jgi:hypothetical protein
MFVDDADRLTLPRRNPRSGSATAVVPSSAMQVACTGHKLSRSILANLPASRSTV